MHDEAEIGARFVLAFAAAAQFAKARRPGQRQHIEIEIAGRHRAGARRRRGPAEGAARGFVGAAVEDAIIGPRDLAARHSSMANSSGGDFVDTKRAPESS